MCYKTEDEGNMVEDLNTACCISGGGPAGVMLGFLLARSGVDVLVLEKYPDFFRDFRGDTIHPSTMEILNELGILEEFLKLPHEEIDQLIINFENEKLTIADFSSLHLKHPTVGIMPQWDFLNFMTQHAKKYPTFHLRMNTEVIDLIQKEGIVKGVVAKGPEGVINIHSKLVVGADGRHSTVREKTGLTLKDIGAPNDVLWFRLPRYSTDPKIPLLNIGKGQVLILINRKDYWQCGYMISKGSLDKIRQQGLESLFQHITEIVSFLKDRLKELKSWDDIKLLDVRINRLTQWYKPGVLCIGDAAHAMSPIGGVGVNLAIQDAVAAANILINPLLSKKKFSTEILRAVQRRREFPTKLIQRFQVFIQDHVIKRVLDPHEKIQPPLFMKLTNKWPYLRRFPAKLIGVGWRLEHVPKKKIEKIK